MNIEALWSLNHSYIKRIMKVTSLPGLLYFFVLIFIEMYFLIAKVI
jgi:hypothetical protein